MDELVYVYVGLGGAPQFCGRLWARARKGQDGFGQRTASRSSPRCRLAPAHSIPGKGRHCLERSATRLRIAGDAC